MKRFLKSFRGERGFTLIELLIAMLISLGVPLAAIEAITKHFGG